MTLKVGGPGVAVRVAETPASGRSAGPATAATSVGQIQEDGSGQALESGLMQPSTGVVVLGTARLEVMGGMHTSIKGF